MEDQLEIIEERIAYLRRIAALLRKEGEALNALIIYYEQNSHAEDELTRLRYNLDSARSMIREAEIENDIAAKEQQVEELVSRLSLNDETKAWLEAARANKENLSIAASHIITDEQVDPQVKDRVRALIGQIMNDDFDKLPDQKQLTVYATLSKHIDAFNHRPARKRIIQ